MRSRNRRTGRERGQHHRPRTPPAGERRGGQCPGSRAQRAQAEKHTEGGRAHPERPQQVQGPQGVEQPEREGGAGIDHRQGPQPLITVHIPQALADLLSQPAGLRAMWGGFSGLDAGSASSADQEGDDVAEQGPGGAEHRGQRGAEVTSGGRGDCEQRAHAAVAPLDQGPVDEAGQEADGRRVVQHARRALHHGDDHELREGQRAQRGRHRHRGEHRDADQVTGDHLPALGVPVGERAGVQGEQRGRELPEERQPRDLGGGGVQVEHGQHRQRHLGDRAAGHARGLSGQVPAEVPVPLQRVAGGRGWGGGLSAGRHGAPPRLPPGAPTARPRPRAGRARTPPGPG